MVIPGATDQGVQAALLNHSRVRCCKIASPSWMGSRGRTRTRPSNPYNGWDGCPPQSHGALYFPWILVRDPTTKTNRAVPPSGHLAGIYARTDATRGVQKPPANAVIRGALAVQRLVSKREQAELNLEGVNIIRTFNGSVTVWGARTWADRRTEAEWTYINVRRLFLYLRKSIEQGTQWVVFEPNEPGLWAKITRNLTAFLTDVWRDGALFGRTPQEALYVKCDAETNPPELRELGQVVTEIGVAVVKPAEFVIFRISQWAGPGQ